MKSSPRFPRFVALVVVCACLPAWGNNGATVAFTKAIRHRVQPTVRLSGTVVSQSASIVASEIEGLVVEVEVEEGDRVREGAPLARLRQVSLELRRKEEVGRLNEANARLHLAESKLNRAKRLFDEQVISQDDLDDAHSERAAWQGRVDQATAAIAQLDVALTRAVIRAPFTGVITGKRTEVGQWIARGGDVAEMVSLDRLEVRVDVPERYYRQLQVGLEAGVTFEALPEVRLNGDVQGVVRRADPQSRTFPIRIGIKNPGGQIGVGMLAQVTLPGTGEPEAATLVPKDAVVRRGAQELIYRINGDETVEVVEVQSGHGMGPWVVVAGPIEEGQRVVTRGNERLMPGQPVNGTAQEYPRP